MKRLMILVLLVGTAACAPRAAPFESAEAAQSFSLNVDGVAAVRTGGTFVHRGADVEMDVTLERDRVIVALTNLTGSEMQFDPDASRFVLPDGSTSRMITGATSWTTRDDPQSPVVIPAGGTTIQTLIPRERLRYADGLIIDPMFDWPLGATATLRLVLRTDVGDAFREIDMVFTGRP
jgi:hypothetical protein